MATEVKNETKEEQTEKKGIWQIPEVKMLMYVLPVATVLLVLALILGK